MLLYARIVVRKNCIHKFLPEFTSCKLSFSMGIKNTSKKSYRNKCSSR